MTVERRGPSWLQAAADALGIRVCNRVTAVYLQGSRINDGLLKELKGLDYLESVALHRTQVTDAGLATLRQALPNLKIVVGSENVNLTDRPGQSGAGDPAGLASMLLVSRKVAPAHQPSL